MIDMLVMRCRFRQGWQDFNLRELGIPLQATIHPDGQTGSLRHAWEVIPSSLGSLAMKVFFNPESKLDPDPWLEIKGSPAKLIQGHNVWGSEHLGRSAYRMIEVLFEAYPSLFSELDQGTWTVAQVDVTYHSRARSPTEATQFINALQHVSKGQTKARSGYNGTAYFGKRNSRLRSIKVYDKYAEVLAYLEHERRRGDPQKVARHFSAELIEWTKGMIRWEATVKTRWLERRGYPTALHELAKVFDPRVVWRACLEDLFEALEGQDMRLRTDEDVLEALKGRFHTLNTRTGKLSYGAAMAAYRTYRAIKAEGWDQVKEVTTSSTLSRHIGIRSSR